DRADILYDADEAQRNFMLAAIERCANDQRSVVEPGANGVQLGENKCPFDLTFTPLLHGKGGGAVQGVQVSWWSRGAAKNGAEFTGLLELCAPYAARTIRSQKLESMSHIAEKLQLMTLFMAEVCSTADSKTQAVSVVNRAREILACDRVCQIVVREHGQLELLAISNVLEPDPRSSIARTIVQLAEHAVQSGLPAIYRKANEKTEEKGDLSDYFFHSHMQEVLVLGVQASGAPKCGLLVFESDKMGFFDAPKQQNALALATQTAGPMTLALEAEQMPFRRHLVKVARWKMLPREEKQRQLLRKLWIPLAVAAALLLVPLPFNLPGTCRLVPVNRAVVVAQLSGRIAEVKVSDGDRVAAGDVIAQLDDNEQKSQLQIARQEELRAQTEADQFTALNQRGAAAVARLQAERARNERQLHEDRLARTAIRSPMDGIVMTPDLDSRQGDAVTEGTQIAVVADSSEWKLNIDISEADVALLLDRLKAGKKVGVTYVLNSLPKKKFQAEVSDEGVVSSAAEVKNGRNTFQVSVNLPDEPEFEKFFRAGYSGSAKLGVGYSPLIYSATRRFFNWLRTNVTL
ncbi:MAG: efflux RND transporter periplasmic adaptor subunit, partial [Chthoniobacterales bacterium]|nr:efflux RND transporter periplasmic adaptor subunit [Chthoniobacterales bacterium]